MDSYIKYINIRNNLKASGKNVETIEEAIFRLGTIASLGGKKYIEEYIRDVEQVLESVVAGS